MQYIVPPVSAEMKMIINKHATAKKMPTVHVEIDIADSKIVISQKQYQNLIQLLEYYIMISKKWKVCFHIPFLLSICEWKFSSIDI